MSDHEPCMLTTPTTDELYRSALRVTQQVSKFSSPPVVHDGTRMVMVPEGIFDRFERAVEVARKALAQEAGDE